MPWLLTFDLDSPLVAVVRASQADSVVEVFGGADTLVATIVAVVFAVTHLRPVYALAIVANVHAVAIHASLPQLVIIELLVEFERASRADIAVAQQTDVAFRSKKKKKNGTVRICFRTIAHRAAL